MCVQIRGVWSGAKWKDLERCTIDLRGSCVHCSYFYTAASSTLQQCALCTVQGTVCSAVHSVQCSAQCAVQCIVCSSELHCSAVCSVQFCTELHPGVLHSSAAHCEAKYCNSIGLIIPLLLLLQRNDVHYRVQFCTLHSSQQ